MDENLLRLAREAATRLTDGQHLADRAKVDYHHAIRRLHLGGASLREIADALELSHQRVHQIIESTGGTGGWKSSRKPASDMSCTFCGLSADEVAKLIAGPGIFICDECVARVRRVADVSSPQRTSRADLDPLPEGSRLKCSFCGKPKGRISAMVEGERLAMCADCIQLCEEILAAAT